MAIDQSNGDVYVAIFTSNLATTVFKYSGASWARVGQADIKADMFGDMVSWLGFTGSTLKFVSANADASNGRIYRYNGATWVIDVSNIYIAGNAYYDGSELYITGIEWDSPMDPLITIKASAPLTTMIIPGYKERSGGVSVYASEPYVFYNTSGLTAVQKYSGASWVDVGADQSAFALKRAQSLVMNGATPYIIFTDASTNNNPRIMQYNGSTWEYVGATQPLVNGSTIGKLGYNSGALYYAYKDGTNSNKLTVKKFQ